VGPARESLANPRLWLAFLTMLLAAGVANAFPVFYPALLEEFGGSRGATAATASLYWLLAAALMPLAGHWVGRYGPRVVVSAGLLATATGLALGTRAPTLPLFILAVGGLGGAGAALTGMVVHAPLISAEYRHRRGLATGVAFSGSMLAFSLSPAIQGAITAFGWRGAFALYIAAVLLLLPPVWLIHPRRLASGTPASPLGARGLSALLAAGWFWPLLAVFSLPPLIGYLAVTQHAVYFTALGLSPGEAAWLLGLGGALATSGRALAGWLADRIGGVRAGLLSFGSTLLGLLFLLAMDLWPARLVAWGYVLFLFLPMGSRATIVAVLVSRIAPPERYGLVFGLLAVGNSLGAAAGPWLSGAVFDLTQSYAAVFLAAAGFTLAALAALLAFARAARAAT
jgi:MFS family permease